MNEESPGEVFHRKFRLDDLRVHENNTWIVSVRPEQLTLGSMVVSVKSGALGFGELSGEEGAGLVEALAAVERVAKGLYGAVRINAVCLMMKDPIVHFHVIPRYGLRVKRYGRLWEDEDWPGPPAFRQRATEEAVLRSLVDDLSEEFGRRFG